MTKDELVNIKAHATACKANKSARYVLRLIEEVERLTECSSCGSERCVPLCPSCDNDD